jgi:hypothetical protein
MGGVYLLFGHSAERLLLQLHFVAKVQAYGWI